MQLVFAPGDVVLLGMASVVVVGVGVVVAASRTASLGASVLVVFPGLFVLYSR